jgi:hypothetical protein
VQQTTPAPPLKKLLPRKSTHWLQDIKPADSFGGLFLYFSKQLAIAAHLEIAFFEIRYSA